MKSVTPLSRHFSTARQLQNLVLSTPKLEFTQKSSALSEELCGDILDQYPDIKTLKKLHSKIIVDQPLCSNPSIGIKLMRAYAACGEPGITRHVFDEIPEKNVVFFNVMIRSYVNNHLYHDALLVFKTMASQGFQPDNYTYPCALKACSGLENLNVGLQIHGAVVKVGLDLNLFIGNGLVAMYGKCGCLMEARQVLDEMPTRDVVSWNSMVAGYAQNARFDDALEVCKEMEALRLKPDAGTMASLLPAVTNTTSNNVSYVKEIFMKLAKKSVVSWNVMIAVYVNNSMPAEAVAGYVQNARFDDSLEVCKEMEALRLKPDAGTIASLLPAVTNTSSNNVSYVKEVFMKLAKKIVVSWNVMIAVTSMISAFGLNGQGRDAVVLFVKMQDLVLSPDLVAFVLVISGFSHAGLLEKGQYYFKLMTEEYRIIPRIEHYACVVDFLRHSGQEDEMRPIVLSSRCQ
nr:putative pentatricopeptide repeat-containing protein [Quercus suber]